MLVPLYKPLIETTLFLIFGNHQPLTLHSIKSFSGIDQQQASKEVARVSPHNELSNLVLSRGKVELEH